MALLGQSKKHSALEPAQASARTLPFVLVPTVSEKGTRLQALGQYTFAVDLKLNKVQIKRAIERVYGVNVVGINSLRLPRKTVRRGRQVGTTRIRRYMRVRLKAGQSLGLTSTK